MLCSTASVASSSHSVRMSPPVSLSTRAYSISRLVYSRGCAAPRQRAVYDGAQRQVAGQGVYGGDRMYRATASSVRASAAPMRHAFGLGRCGARDPLSRSVSTQAAATNSSSKDSGQPPRSRDSYLSTTTDFSKLGVAP